MRVKEEMRLAHIAEQVRKKQAELAGLFGVKIELKLLCLVKLRGHRRVHDEISATGKSGKRLEMEVSGEKTPGR
jgi:hypothetical protein